MPARVRGVGVDISFSWFGESVREVRVVGVSPVVRKGLV